MLFFKMWLDISTIHARVFTDHTVIAVKGIVVKAWSFRATNLL